MRFRKRINICKGVKLNLSKSGVSLSLGVKGATLHALGTQREQQEHNACDEAKSKENDAGGIAGNGKTVHRSGKQFAVEKCSDYAQQQGEKGI